MSETGRIATTPRSVTLHGHIQDSIYHAIYHAGQIALLKRQP
ncbi:MAG: hypothetical protein OXE53_09615 [Deltaproteobacteria bacterium]|nr:hypothetical protein [Deltaproteobacteria bacterium]